MFVYSDNVFGCLELSISSERFATYINHAHGNKQRAIELYEWNAAVSSAFYNPLQALEVTMRNTMARELSCVYGAAWYDNPRCQLDYGSSKRIESAKNKLRRNKYQVDPPHMLAELSFGFWVSLLGPGGKNCNYEMELWRPILYKSFPAVKKGRKDVHKPLDYLRTFRNRIAHYEPIFKRHLEQDYLSILECIGWMCPVTEAWVAHHSQVTATLSAKPDYA